MTNRLLGRIAIAKLAAEGQLPVFLSHSYVLPTLMFLHELSSDEFDPSSHDPEYTGWQKGSNGRYYLSDSLGPEGQLPGHTITPDVHEEDVWILTEWTREQWNAYYNERPGLGGNTEQKLV